MWRWAVCFLLVGCGLPDKLPADCMVPAGQVDKGAWRHNLNLTSLILADAQLETEESFAANYCGLPVTVKDDACLEDLDRPGWCSLGVFYRNPQSIVLERTGVSLLHEVLHARDLRLGVDDHNHDTWPQRGYSDADVRFKTEFAPLR